MLAGLFALSGETRASRPPDFCRPARFDRIDYLVCEIDPARLALSIGHNSAGEGEHGTVGDHFHRMASAGRAPLLVMNAGMYREDLSPLGLLIEDGGVRSPLNEEQAPGNFFLKPNGVFWLDGKGQGHIQESGAFAETGSRPAFATQSGPLLVSGGKLHEAIAFDGPSKFVRNAVGVAKSGSVNLVISLAPVSMGALARFMRDGLGCDDVLYLDGVVSAAAGSGDYRLGGAYPAGPVIRVEPRG